LLVPTVQLQDQFLEEFDKWGVDSTNVEIMCYQSAYKLKDEEYSIVVCDEIHLGLSPKYRQFFENNAYEKLLCVTATLPEEPEYKVKLHMIAPTVYHITLDQCVELGIVAPYKIYCKPVSLTASEMSDYKKVNNSFVYYKYKLGQFDAFNEAKRIMGDSSATGEEKGYAAHYKYKNADAKEDNLDLWINRLQEALENHEADAVDFVEQFKLNLYSKEIFVFSPKGDLKSLPKGATPLDFAFSIHTEIGMKTRGAKVNGKLVPLSTELKSGDRVEVMTSENAKPNANWLDYATTARARSKIKSALNEDTKLIAEEGKEILRRKLKQLKINLNESSINDLVSYFKLNTSLDLFYRVGIGTIDNTKLKAFASSRSNAFVSYFKNKIYKPSVPKDIHKEEITSKYDMLVFGKEEEKLNYTLANCCNPIPGDKVFGFLTINDGIKIHKKNCPNAVSLQSNYAYRILQAKWIDSSQQVYTSQLTLSGIDDMGLVNHITKLISENMHVNMKSLSFSSDDGVFTGKITVDVKNQTMLKKLMDNLKKINGIDKVTRV
ncbi:TGS domain-containing protein, partial [uncultured Winogradskyella sp.]|uniref:TGS domain-containing protein n=1 Tax=uncultured Winogradskyella sp. TaxID=395353 RepID=UPI0030EC2F0E